jgi:peptide-methionine (S)-S-oxide reductase
MRSTIMLAESPSRALPCAGDVRPLLFTGGIAALVGAAFLVHSTFAAEELRLVAAAQRDVSDTGKPQVAVFAGGCFWGVQGVFQHVKGVIDATSGYAGGSAATANYETVETGTTDQAEPVRVIFDPQWSATASSCKSTFRLPTIRHKSIDRDPT